MSLTIRAIGLQVALLAAGLCAARGEPPAVRTPINPPELFLPRPDESSRVDGQATLGLRLKAAPTSLNPVLMYTAIDAVFDYLLWDRPVVLNSRLEWTLNPQVAESYTESADHTSAELRLKGGLTWQDGTPFTAEDLAFSWARITDERVVARKARQEAEQLAACEVVDVRTVRFRFRAASPTNRWAAAFPILPRHIYSRGLEEDATLERSDYHVQHNRQPVGNGPYRCVRWETDQRIVLERWEEYPGPRPAFKQLIFRIIPDSNAALLAFESGQLDETELTPQQFARETDGARFAARGVKAQGTQWTVYYIGWNTAGSNPFFADVRVRRALTCALNLPLIRERVFFDLFPAAQGLWTADSPVGAAAPAEYVYDLNRAGLLLDEAGWQRDSADGWRYKSITDASGAPQRTRLAFTLNLPQGSSTAPQIADLFREDLRRLGVDLQTQVLDWAVFNERNFKHDFQAFFSAWTAGPEPDEAWNLFHSSARAGGRNYVGYANPVVDELFERARNSFDEEERRATYRRLAGIISADAPCSFLVHAPTLWAFNCELRGVQLSPRGPLCFHPGLLAWWKPAPSGSGEPGEKPKPPGSRP